MSILIEVMVDARVCSKSIFLLKCDISKVATTKRRCALIHMDFLILDSNHTCQTARQ